MTFRALPLLAQGLEKDDGKMCVATPPVTQHEPGNHLSLQAGGHYANRDYHSSCDDA